MPTAERQPIARALAFLVVFCLAAARAGGATTLRMGSLELTRCGRAYCGELARPLDPTGEVRGELAIHFEFHPHRRAGPARGTLVATEGGPGYPATESRADYLALFEPLLAERDLVLMDNRGTGRSGALDCPGLQLAERTTTQDVGACGRSLGERAPLYGTAFATDDLAAILDALGIPVVDLYGDSYGTYFAQEFAVRHPRRLRSLVLDGAYPLSGADYPWYPTYAPAMRAKFNLACARDARCAALPGDSMAHIQPALEALRAGPSHARAPDLDGHPREFTADAAALAIVLFGGAPAYTTATEVDAAARAFAANDRAPLLRLMAETAAAVDSRDPAANPASWSAGLAVAVMCQDPPQIFDMRLAPQERAAQRDRALEDRRRSVPDTYAPFTIDEYRGMPLDYSFLDQCVDWPAAPASHPAARVGVDAVYPDVPVLVISGEFDDMTSPADGAAAAAHFKQGVQVLIANSFHVNALPRARSGCGAALVRHFVATLSPGDTGCAREVPPLRLVPAFALSYRAVPAAAGLAGNRADPTLLSAATAAERTVLDILARAPQNESGRGTGLRGGSYRIVGRSPLRIALTRVRWTGDLEVSGTILAAPGPSGRVHARLSLRPADDRADAAARGMLELLWPTGVDGAPAHIDGHLGSRRLLAMSASVGGAR